MKTVKVVGRFDALYKDNSANSLAATASGCSLQTALSKAIRIMLKNPELKRKRIHNVTFEVEVVENETKELSANA